MLEINALVHLWQRIGYSPRSWEEIQDDFDEETEEVIGGIFTPVKTATNSVFAGICIKNLPSDIDQTEVVEFLCFNGLPEEHIDDISVSDNGTFFVKNLSDDLSKALIEKLHRAEFCEKRLFCNGVIPLSPAKLSSDGVDKSCIKPAAEVPQSSTSIVGAAETISLAASTTIPTPAILETDSTCLSTTLLSPGKSSISDVENLVRRHSLSLKNRTSPENSLACQLSRASPRPDFQNTNRLVNELKERLSDFGSCISDSSDHENLPKEPFTKESSDTDKNGSHSSTEKNGKKKKKRKIKFSPEQRETFLKKSNLLSSQKNSI